MNIKKMVTMLLIVVAIFSACGARATSGPEGSIAHELTSGNRMRLERGGLVNEDSFVEEISLICDSVNPSNSYFVWTVFADPKNGETVQQHQIRRSERRSSAFEHAEERREELLGLILDYLWYDEELGHIKNAELVAIAVSWETRNIFGAPSRYAVYDKDADGIWDVGLYSAKGTGPICINFIATGAGSDTKQVFSSQDGWQIELNDKVERGAPFSQVEYIIRNS